jgi:Flavin containing amine oxidoreductase/SWIRM domain
VELRSRTSIPPRLSWDEFARQGVVAAYCSRLNPYALHPGEYQLLRSHITRPQVTLYLMIRNAILRLWHRNPLVPVTRTDAAGCTRDSRHIALSQFALEWLLRNGYINFGCLATPSPLTSNLPSRLPKRKTIVVIGAGLSGLGCARQLDSLFMQMEDQFLERGQYPPEIVVLEGRHRIGGRVFSNPLTESKHLKLPPGMRSTAEMGAQIVTGWDHGNPLSIIVRGQLALPYHTLREESPLYDFDGHLVDKSKDTRVEKLWNYILERASVFRNQLPTVKTVEGERNLINFFEDPKEAIGERLPMIADLETQGISVTITDGNPVSMNANMPEHSAKGVEKVAGRQYQHVKATADLPAAQAAKTLGWQLRPGVSLSQDIDLTPVSQSSRTPTLGEALDDGIRQIQGLIEMGPQDLRLMNWHHANLEYANAANVNDLSLGGWDQDVGNEFEGAHSEIVGGYSQVPRGLWKLPLPLDIRFKHAVKSIKYFPYGLGGSQPAVVQCENGELFKADKIVLTVPLGVLKTKAIEFDPPLPQWKTDCVARMGFGLLNKVCSSHGSKYTDLLGGTCLSRTVLGRRSRHVWSAQQK